MKTFNLFILFSLFIATTNVQARTDVKEQLKKLKTNHVNSSENYKNYKGNYDISVGNIKEIKEALVIIGKLKRELKHNDKNIKNNKRVLNKMIAKFNEYKKNESTEISKETSQIEKLKGLIAKLEGNIEKRQANISAYDEKVIEINQEIADWDTKNRDIAQVKELLASKENMTSEDLKDWQAKKKDYKTEAIKWSKKANILKKTYVRIKRLNE